MARNAAGADGQTLMDAEAGEAARRSPRFARRQPCRRSQRIGARLRAHPPEVVVTCARGSSDHAATYGKYLIETLTGVPTSLRRRCRSRRSIRRARSPSRAEPAVHRDLAIGPEPRPARRGRGAARARAPSSSRWSMPRIRRSPRSPTKCCALNAGPERSVAATKSYIASLAGLAALVAAWTGTTRSAEALERLPAQLAARLRARLVGGAAAALADASSLFVHRPRLWLRRRAGGGAQAQGNLRRCTPNASAPPRCSHGPMAIVGDGFPILALRRQRRGGRRRPRDRCGLFASRGANGAAGRYRAAPAQPARARRASGDRADPDDPELLPHGQRSSRSRAASIPTRPPILNKVTETL